MERREGWGCEVRDGDEGRGVHGSAGPRLTSAASFVSSAAMSALRSSFVFFFGRAPSGSASAFFFQRCGRSLLTPVTTCMRDDHVNM